MGDEGVKTGKYLIQMSSFALAIVVSASSFVFIGKELDVFYFPPRHKVIDVFPVLPVYLTNECDAHFYHSLVGMKADDSYIQENYPYAVFVDKTKDKYPFATYSYHIIITVKKDNDGIIREILCK